MKLEKRKVNFQTVNQMKHEETLAGVVQAMLYKLNRFESSDVEEGFGVYMVLRTPHFDHVYTLDQKKSIYRIVKHQHAFPPTDNKDVRSVFEKVYSRGERIHMNYDEADDSRAASEETEPIDPQLMAQIKKT